MQLVLFYSLWCTFNCVSLFFSSFGLAPAGPLQVLTPLSPNQTIDVSLPLSTSGPVMKMEPLNNLQVIFPLHFCSIILYTQCENSVVLLRISRHKAITQAPGEHY